MYSLTRRSARNNETSAFERRSSPGDDSVCASLFLVFRRIGEYISLDQFYPLTPGSLLADLFHALSHHFHIHVFTEDGGMERFTFRLIGNDHGDNISPFYSVAPNRPG